MAALVFEDSVIAAAKLAPEWQYGIWPNWAKCALVCDEEVIYFTNDNDLLEFIIYSLEMGDMYEVYNWELGIQKIGTFIR